MAREGAGFGRSQTGLFGGSLPLAVRSYVTGVILVGLPVFAYCLYVAFGQNSVLWLYIALLTIVASFFPITIPSVKPGKQSLSVTASDVLVFSSLLLFGPEVAATICVLDGLVSNLRIGVNRGYKLCFNISETCLATLLSGELFYLLTNSTPPFETSQIESPLLFFLYMDLCGLLYFLLSSGAVALAISLATGRPLFAVWDEDFHYASLMTIAGVSLAALIFFTFEQHHLLTFAVAVFPIMLVLYATYKAVSDRVLEARRHVDEMGDLYRSTIASLAMAIDAKDQCTRGHVHRVQALTLGLARLLGIRDESVLQALWAASLLHDIGKIATPEYILKKPAALTHWETRRMRAHPRVGADILSTIAFPYPVVPFVRFHHERWDGAGYPQGLKGEGIPLGARIISIADCYDALRSDRPYRPRLSKEAALDFLKTQAGRAFDPEIVAVLMSHIDELEALMETTEKRLPPSVVGEFEDTPSAGLEEESLSMTVFHDVASAQWEALNEISSRLLEQAMTVGEVLLFLAEQIRELAPYDACAVYLISSRSGRLRPFQTAGSFSDAVQGIELRMGEGISGWVAANNQPLLNVSPSPDFQAHRCFMELFQSCLSLPLAIDRNVLGVITLYSKTTDAYRPDHLLLLESITPSAASAVKNGVIYEEASRSAVTVERVKSKGRRCAVSSKERS